MFLKTNGSLWRTDSRLLSASVLTVLFHGGLLASGSFQRTYDAYVHLFFADHYARSWFSSWETRWYTGFPVVSYPPGVHQLLGALKGVLGPGGAYVVVQLAALLVLVVGVYRFATLWVGARAAGWAAIAVVLSSSIAEVVHVFGQLPTTLALGFLLNAQPSVARWVQHGQRRDLAYALAFLASTTAVHHVTTLFGSVFFTGPVVARVVLDAFARPHPDEPEGRVRSIRAQDVVPVVARRLRRMLPELMRVAALGASIVFTLAIVILPYWLWSSRDPIVQVPIPHGSRDNFLENTAAGLVFFLVPTASVLLVLPMVIFRTITTKLWPLTASVLLLLLLGSGGTTPIPRLLLGGAFEILTLDRFTIWATVAVLPLVGLAVEALIDTTKWTNRSSAFGRQAPAVFLAAMVVAAVSSTLFAASLASLRPMQPDPIDPDPIVSFLEKDDHDRWRYVMLGFGDQMAAVSAETTALTVDGNYHSARRLPELTSRSVERLEGAKFRGVPGLGSLQQFLANPDRYNLKFAFVNDAFYEPLLWSMGWNRLGELDNDIVVWERADVAPLPKTIVVREIPRWQRVMWGVLPPMAMLSAVVAAGMLVVQRAPSNPSCHGGRLTRRLDTVLAVRAARLEEVERHPYRTRLLPQMRAEFSLPPAAVRAVAGIATGVAIAGAVLLLLGAQRRGPADAVVDYYEHLDMQDYTRAWEALDPAIRLPLGDHLQDQSLRDGLLDGYAELDSVTINDVAATGEQAVVEVELEYLTSLETIHVQRTHRLTMHDGHWKLLPDDPEPLPTNDQMVAVDATKYVAASADRQPDGTVATEDRPLSSVDSARLITVDGVWIALGEVTNHDRWPAQITVTATLRDEDGATVATALATTHTLHTVMPGETVPYRIDFASDLTADFSPDGGSATILQGRSKVDASALEVTSRAVLTTHRTARDLALVDLSASPDGLVAATLLNTGAGTATVPKVVVSSYDSAGALIWVDTMFVPRSAVPGARLLVEMNLTAPSPGTPNAVVTVPPSMRELAERWPEARLAIDGPNGVASIAVHLVGFTRASVS